MKKVIAVFAALLLLAAFVSCKNNKPSPTPAPADNGGYKALLDNCVELAANYSRELAEKCIPSGMIEKQVAVNKEQGRDFWELLKAQFDDQRALYAETYGDDWKITYTVIEAVEKDEKGIENYKQFDSHYFTQYGIDASKISAVTFAKVNMHIEGSRDSNDKEKTIQCFCIDGNWYSFYAVMMGLRL